MSRRTIWWLVIAAGICGAIGLSVVNGRDGTLPADQPARLPNQGEKSAAHTEDPALPSPQRIDVRQSRQELDRSYTAAVACLQSSRIAEQQKSLLGAQTAGPTNSAPQMSPELRSRWREAERACGGKAPLDAASIEELAMKAGLQGNVDAAICYASGMLKSRSHDSPPSKDGRYPLIAQSLIEQGIRAGNWSAVSVAAASNGPRYAGSPYLELPPPSTKLQHMYTKLKELGAENDEKLDLQLVLLEQAKSLQQSERFDAEEEASRLYATYFSRSGPFAQDSTVLCGGF